ncbi:hypothetical protein DAPPUDRAFT_117514 [Daphnia pulex]|uniref:Uncharacterized protein n=1 Tax=Daphnia pulex TaxID=6669 RepID=E9HSX9_DAPPU|nr:hypothetical protein DAPPUDRAFT_117514 [Daphnia pulex]|eukprot:EFX65150.1 hypothetical protein DAPPUDRAFT_117514 [Daphnia pulex]
MKKKRKKKKRKKEEEESEKEESGKEDEEEDKEVENNDEISNKNNGKITDLNKKRQSDVAGQEPETFIDGNTLEEQERPNQNRFKQKAIKPAEIGTQPVLNVQKGEKEKHVTAIQETNRRIFYWIQNGEEEEKEEREEDSPYVFFCENCEEDLDNWSRQPTGAATEKKNGEKEEPEPKRSRQDEDNGGDAEEPEPKRQRIANFDNSGVEKSKPSTSGTIPPNVEE